MNQQLWPADNDVISGYDVPDDEPEYDDDHYSLADITGGAIIAAGFFALPWLWVWTLTQLIR